MKEEATDENEVDRAMVVNIRRKVRPAGITYRGNSIHIIHYHSMR